MRVRSLREARAIAQFDHVNVVRVFDVLLSADGDPQIVMEYVPSRSLHDAITTDGPIPPARAAAIGLAVLGALRAAADLEWVYTSDTGTAMHGRQRTFTTAKRKGYSIAWLTPEATWAAGVEAFREVTAGFRPGSAPGDATPSTRPELSVSPTPSAPAARSGYRLVGVASNRCLDIAAPDSPDPVRLHLADCRDDRARNQLWTMKPDGSVQLGGRCLDVLGASSDAGAAIQLTTCNTTPAQRFTLDGDQHLVNAHSGMCLGAVGQSTASGALIEQRSCGAGTNHLRWTRR